MGSLGRALALAALTTVGACAGPPPSGEPVPEPTEPLRDAAHRGVVPEDARIADYVIDARLDEVEHVIEGTARITWRNRTSRTVHEMPLHLYMNAFRAEDTAWMREARGRHRGQARKPGGWGLVDVRAIRRLGAGHLEAGEMRPSTPVDLAFAEDADPSTMTVQLGTPILPGEAVTLEIEFTTRLPRVFARTGYHEDFQFVGQWYPKVGVLEEEAGWQAHVFTLQSEFYADFGDYEVHLDVPENTVVGATGIRTSDEVADGRRQLTYRAQMVHDFAWTAHPDYVEHLGEYEGIRIRQLLQPEHAQDGPAHLDAQKLALASFEAHYGAYPWSTITIVHVPDGASGAGGMEYPTLYTTSDIALPVWVPPWLFEERVSGIFTTVHEFGHQYFQGLFASNESAQPWLDEGMNTMADIVAYHDAWGEDAWIARLLGRELTTGDMVRASLLQGALLDPVDQPAHAYRGIVGSYGAMAYQKTAATFMTLRALVGIPAFDRAMATYAERARFRHPTGAQLEAVFVRELGERVALEGGVQLHLTDFFEQTLREVSECDFSVHLASNRRLVGTAGWHRDPAGELVETPTGDGFDDPPAKVGDEQVEGTVILHRRGGLRVPVELLVEFGDGTRERVVWDGQARHHTFTWPGRRVRMAVVDPERKLWLEARRLDNAAFALGQRESPSGDGLSGILGDWSEAATLALLGGIGP
jgi:hypothetical protein